MKKITSIRLNNFKGYFGEYAPIKLPNGENLLIYGENGSGKSSLYKALNNFFLSSIDPQVKFTKNKYSENEPGKISIEFTDYDSITKKIIVDTNTEYTFSDTLSNHNIPLVQNIATVKAFLDYTDLLKIYYHNEPNPNLFDLIVLNILGEYIPISSGGNFKFKDKWIQLEYHLTRGCYTRNDLKHRKAYAELPTFETHLRATLDQVFIETNKLLTKYFKFLDVELSYTLNRIKFNYSNWKSDWNTTKDLKLLIKKYGEVFNDSSSNFLNEARLSAVAISMYFATLSLTNKNMDLKVLYLDDVFIGLDSGNRIPILRILKDIFQDYQIFISTYDRQWFEMAKRFFQQHDNNLWKSIELYVGQCKIANGTQIDKPLIIEGKSYFDKAIQYLYHNIKPDYPAAANYFRKALEEIIVNYMINFQLIDDDGIQIPEYKLSSLAYRVKRFFERSNKDIRNINTIIGFLHTLLHPLSHHEIDSPIYKYELKLIEEAFLGLRDQLMGLNANSYQCKLERGSKLKLKFLIANSPRHSYEYELKIKDSIILHKQDTNIDSLPVQCFISKMSGIKNDATIPEFRPTDERYSYSSLLEAFDKLYDFLVNKEGQFTKQANYLDSIEYYKTTGWVQIKELFEWEEKED